MKLEPPPPRYDPAHESRRNATLERDAKRAFARDQDNEVGLGRIILTAPNGTRWALSVSNAGALSAVAV